MSYLKFIEAFNDAIDKKALKFTNKLKNKTF